MSTATVLSYSIRTAVDATSLSRSHLTDAINRGDLKARRSSKDEKGNPQGKWLILAADLEAYIASLPEA